MYKYAFAKKDIIVKVTQNLFSLFQIESVVNSLTYFEDNIMMLQAWLVELIWSIFH